MTNEYKQIVEALISQTKTRKIEWLPTNIRNQFSVSLGDGTVVVDYFDDDNRMDEMPLYKIAFLNMRDETIENLCVWDDTNEDYNLFHSLWTELTDSYFKRSETLGSIRAALGID